MGIPAGVIPATVGMSQARSELLLSNGILVLVLGHRTFRSGSNLFYISRGLFLDIEWFSYR